VRRTALLVLACSVLALAAGIYLGGHPDTLPGPVRDALVDENRAVRSQIEETIRDNFYRPVDESKLDDASLKGIVESLDDPYSRYITPKEASEFQERVSGEFEGVGMSVEKDDRGLRVLNVFDGSPAANAGIHKQDLILSVDGRSIAGLSSDLATSRIKGPAGTRVELEVFTPGGEDSRTVRVERERIHVPVATGRVVERDGHKIGVVRLISFTNGAHGVLRRQVNKVLDDGAQAIVLDLRGNGGGLLTEAVLVSSIFIEDGKIVSVRGRERPERTDNAEGDAIDPDIPVAVLVDGGSASASEIVTGALRDRHRATVVGTNTFGKGLVQEVEPLSNGGYLDLTVANYYLPGGETISTRGLKPQVKAFDKPRTKPDEALPVALDVLTGKL
jgi:carboxyl-terminal processing protease